MTLLVFGDSHAACLIEAWRTAGGAATRPMAFFVRPGGGPFQHRITDQRLTAEGDDFRALLARLDQPVEHDLAAQQAFALVGCGLSLFLVVQVLNLYRVLDWNPEPFRDDRPALSEAVLRRAVAEAMQASPAAQVMADLRALPGLADRPIHLLPQPYPSERVLDDKANAGRAIPGGAGLRRMARRGFTRRAVDLFLEESARFAATFGATFHPQPPESVVQDGFTALAYSTEARRLVNLAQAQRATDILHANRAYGDLLLNRLPGIG